MIFLLYPRSIIPNTTTARSIWERLSFLKEEGLKAMLPNIEEKWELISEKEIPPEKLQQILALAEKIVGEKFNE